MYFESIMLIIGICIIVFLYFRKRNDVHNGSIDISSYLEKSDYFGRFNENDLILRKCGNANTCMSSYVSSIRLPNEKESKTLSIMTRQIDARLKGTFDKLNEIEWKFLIFDRQYESGFPHTQGPYIMLPEGFVNITDLPKTLLHEKIHVFQRYNPLETNDFYTKILGFTIKGLETPAMNARANPDTTRLTYLDSNGMIIDNTYKENATKLTDIVDVRDHPNEIMAYELSRMLMERENTASCLKKNHNLYNFIMN